jgi:hypothetical protein
MLSFLLTPSSFPLISPLSLAIIFPFLFLTYILTSYLLNPFRRIPAAHPLVPFTSLWISWIRWRAIENATLKSAHDRLGPIVCLGPKEISVNCVKGGIREVYGGGFEKGDPCGKYSWYSFFSNFGG